MTKVLLWISLALALIGGSGLVGQGMATTVMVIATAGVLLKIFIDIKKDGVPNQDAIVGAFVLPTMISRVNGQAAEYIGGWFEDLWGWAERHMGSWIGTTSMGLALFAIAISFLVSNKTAGARR